MNTRGASKGGVDTGAVNTGQQHRNPWELLVYVVVMQAVVVGIAFYSFTFFVTPWVEAFATSRSTLMIAATGLSIAIAVVSPLCGWLLDKLSSGALLLFGGASFALGLCAVSIASHVYWIIALFTFVLPFGMLFSGTLMASSLVARRFSSHRGAALGISALGSSIGGFVIPLLVAFLLSRYDWRVAFQILAALVMLAVVIPGILLVGGDEADDSGQEKSAATSNDDKHLLSVAVLKLGIAFFVPNLLFVATLHNLGTLAADQAVIAPQAALVVSVASFVMVLSKLGSGMLCDWAGHRWPYLLLLISQLAGLLALGLFSGFIPLMLGVALLAVGTGASLPLVSSYIVDHWGAERFGRVMGVVFAVGSTAGVGAVAAGGIRDFTGGYSLAFILFAALLIPAAWCFFSLPAVKKPAANQ